MGPTIIFDKSALQMLSIDESCWLENFFISNITPLFYVESLADLSKESKDSRTAEQIVSEIAAKTPLMSCFPNIHHGKLIYNELIGREVPMDGRAIVAGGKSKITEKGETLIDHDEFPEAKAMSRWQDQKFKELENQFAQLWRKELVNLAFDKKVALVKNILPSDTKYTDLASIAKFVKEFIKNEPKEILYLLFELLDINEQFRGPIIARWDQTTPKNLMEFSPYTAHVLSVDLFFYLAIHFNLISDVRKSNKIDIAYLYYLPFCNVFVSNDKLHTKTAPLFMREDQVFIQGKDLKDALKYLDDYYEKLPDEIKAQGVVKFAQYPPEEENLVSDLWDKYLTLWRQHLEEAKKKTPLSKEEQAKIVEEMNRIKENSVPLDHEITSAEADSAMFTSWVKPRKGKWKLFPPEVELNKKSRKPTDIV